MKTTASLILALLLAGCDSLTMEGRARTALAGTLKDPASAQFRNLREDSAHITICGEVNAKNGFGGYTGFRPFYAAMDGTTAAVADDAAMDTFRQAEAIYCM